MRALRSDRPVRKGHRRVAEVEGVCGFSESETIKRMNPFDWSRAEMARFDLNYRKFWERRGLPTPHEDFLGKEKG